ncbi:hypothetical protein HMPREF0742_01816 [Rothia aeria F0184]|uniref:Uncharacterized protein n=1 Tax=Rothia aeria F0184 TaxID=888019 RepID=U7V154_9MICC|nr:hypothetical protein HMPREF0742_01816 [Rothia aeria F0184]
MSLRAYAGSAYHVIFYVFFAACRSRFSRVLTYHINTDRY